MSKSTQETKEKILAAVGKLRAAGFGTKKSGSFIQPVCEKTELPYFVVQRITQGQIYSLPNMQAVLIALNELVAQHIEAENTTPEEVIE